MVLASSKALTLFLLLLTRPQCRKSMARIKYVLNERRIAARDAQDLVRNATERSESASTSESQRTEFTSFMEEEVPKVAGTQAL